MGTIRHRVLSSLQQPPRYVARISFRRTPQLFFSLPELLQVLPINRAKTRSNGKCPDASIRGDGEGGGRGRGVSLAKMFWQYGYNQRLPYMCDNFRVKNRWLGRMQTTVALEAVAARHGTAWHGIRHPHCCCCVGPNLNMKQKKITGTRYSIYMPTLPLHATQLKTTIVSTNK